MKAAFGAALESFQASPEERVLLITGTDGIFCAGGDLRSMDATPGTLATRARMAQSHHFARLMERVEKPVIMAVNGAAVGAGVSLAMLGDIVVASDAAWFASGFPQVGVLPDLGLLWTLPRAIGLPRARDFVLSLRRYDAETALSTGLVSRVWPAADFDAEAEALAAQIATGPGATFGLTKRLMNAAQTETFDSYLLREELAQAVVFGTEDFREGTRAFREKRRPKFSGR